MQAPNRLVLCAGTVLALTAAASADVVIDWNNQLLDSIRAVGGPPCPIARGCAMVHTAVYDAVNSINPTHEPFLGLLSAPTGASQEAAAAAAAHAVLVHLYPDRQAIYDAALTNSLAQIPDGQSETDGVAVGVAAANAIIAARADDGTQSEPLYVYGDNPGDYQPPFPNLNPEPFNPGWGNTVPWSMINGQQFRPAGPLGRSSMVSLVRSYGYSLQLNEVKEYGRVDSTSRTPEQTDIAWFWANDRNGTYKPPGHLFHITQVVSDDRDLSVQENARLFCLVAIGMADAGLVAWDAKYNTNIDLWRPVTAVREADNDRNPHTVADPDWVPLLDFTPPFPAYISGHATFGAVHAAIMANYFGTDEVTFTITTDEPFYTGGPRTYTRFSDAAWENAISRIYLGVHYRFDATDGNIAGTRLGNYISHNMLRPVGENDCPADFNNDGALNGHDVSSFVLAWVTEDDSADFDDSGEVDRDDLRAFIRAYVEGCDE